MENLVKKLLYPSDAVAYNSVKGIAARYGVDDRTVQVAVEDSKTIAAMSDSKYKEHVKELRDVVRAGIFDGNGQPTLANKVAAAKSALRVCKLNKNRSKHFMFVPKQRKF